MAPSRDHWDANIRRQWIRIQWSFIPELSESLKLGRSDQPQHEEPDTGFKYVCVSVASVFCSFIYFPGKCLENCVFSKVFLSHVKKAAGDCQSSVEECCMCWACWSQDMTSKVCISIFYVCGSSLSSWDYCVTFFTLAPVTYGDRDVSHVDCIWKGLPLTEGTTARATQWKHKDISRMLTMKQAEQLPAVELSSSSSCSQVSRPRGFCVHISHECSCGSRLGECPRVLNVVNFIFFQPSILTRAHSDISWIYSRAGEMFEATDADICILTYIYIYININISIYIYILKVLLIYVGCNRVCRIRGPDKGLRMPLKCLMNS